MITMKLDNRLIDKYKPTYSRLKHIRIDDDSEGYALITGDGYLVGIVNCDMTRKYITALEVFGSHKGNGHSKQLLDIAVNKLKCNNLSVNKKNHTAIKVYRRYGFRTTSVDDHMYYMVK